jgi:hypothetical protein
VIKSLSRLAVRSFASIAKPTVAPTRHTILATAVVTTRMISHFGRPLLSKPNISTGKINCFYRYIILY